jgi:hypothetical protein
MFNTKQRDFGSHAFLYFSLLQCLSAGGRAGLSVMARQLEDF